MVNHHRKSQLQPLLVEERLLGAGDKTDDLRSAAAAVIQHAERHRPAGRLDDAPGEHRLGRLNAGNDAVEGLARRADPVGEILHALLDIEEILLQRMHVGTDVAPAVTIPETCHETRNIRLRIAAPHNDSQPAPL